MTAWRPLQGKERSRRRRAEGRESLSAAELEPRIAWILGSARNGSAWLLRSLVYPWRLDRTPTGIRRPGSGEIGPPEVLPVNEPDLLMHLTPELIPQYDPVTDPDPGELSRNSEWAPEAAYLFSEHYVDAWRPPLRRLILRRLHAQAQRAITEHAAEDPIVVVNEPDGAHGAEFLMSVLPSSRLIFVVRDGRDAVESILHAHLSGERRQERGPLIAGDYEARLRFVTLHSHLWVLRTVAVQRAYESHPPELRIRIRYEDLLVDPLGELKSLADWLGLERTEADLRAAIEANAFETRPEEGKGLGDGPRSPGPGLWRETLSALEGRIMGAVMGQKLAELGYAS